MALLASPTNHIPSGRYRVMLLATRVTEFSDGVCVIDIGYLLLDKHTGKLYTTSDTIIDDISIPRSGEFFDFLESSHINFKKYQELIGLIFDAVVDFKTRDGKNVPIMTRRNLIAKP